MILDKKPITLAEVQNIVKDLEITPELKDYLKKFTKLKKNKADELAEAIKKLNNPKIKEDDVVKIVDFLPKEKDDLSKILINTELSEEEANALLNIVQKY
jgi:DNA-directed RNA polymerase subunit F